MIAGEGRRVFPVTSQMILRQQKKSLRRRIRDQISCLDPSYCRQADQRIIGRIVSWECFRQADTVFCFVGTDREIHTKPLIQAALDLGKENSCP